MNFGNLPPFFLQAFISPYGTHVGQLFTYTLLVEHERPRRLPVALCLDRCGVERREPMRVNCSQQSLWKTISFNHPEIEFQYRFGQRSAAYSVYLSILYLPQILKGVKNVLGNLANSLMSVSWYSLLWILQWTGVLSLFVSLIHWMPGFSHDPKYVRITNCDTRSLLFKMELLFFLLNRVIFIFTDNAFLQILS